MVNIGLIGLGFMGRMHLAAYDRIDEARIVAVADKDPRRAGGDLSGGWGNIPGAVEHLDMARIRGATDFHEVLAMEEVQVADICVPTPLHEELAIAALRAGKHVLCEKPLALSSDSARRIAEAAAGARGYFMPAMCMRFWPQWRWLRQAVDEGRYGRPLAAAFRRVASMPPGWFRDGAKSGGAVLDLHVHDTDFIHHLFGRPGAVFSRGYAQTTDRIDHIVTQYLYEDGPAAVYAEGAWCLADGFEFSCRYTVNFERATADFDMTREKPLVVYHRGEPEPIDLSGDGYEQELRYFIRCVEEGRAPEVVTAADAVAGIEIVEAERRSVETGRPVEL